jgi:metal transporter CNNM
MGLDLNGLDIVISGGSPKEVENAKKIRPVRQNGNLLLCTLLLGNVGVNAALSILMANMTSGLFGFLISTIVIVIFGEIIPQALCSRHPLAIGAKAVPMVKAIGAVLLVLTWPLAKALDWLLGDEMGTVYNRKEMRKLLKLHEESADADTVTHEAKIMSGALDFGEKKVQDVITPIASTFSLAIDQSLNFAVLTDIFRSGYSRIPVFDRKGDGDPRTDEFIGLLFAKDVVSECSCDLFFVSLLCAHKTHDHYATPFLQLILVDPGDEIPVKTLLNFYGRSVPKVFPDTPLVDVLNEFKTGNSHLAVGGATALVVIFICVLCCVAP